MRSQRLTIGNERGAVAIFVALTLTMFIGVAALAVDVGYMMVGKTELQRTADAAALAATRRLGYIYEGMSYTEQQVYDATGDAAVIQNAAIDVASQNRAAGTSVVINTADIQIGTWNQARNPRFVETLSQPNAVQVTARRDGTASTGPIGTFFARIFGIDNVNVSAEATAALTGQSTVAEGGLPVPIGISQYFFSNPEFCHDNITFYPANSPESCAGWHIFDRTEYNNANDQALRTTIGQLDSGTYTSPALDTDSIFKFTGGTMSQQTFEAMKNLYDHNKDASGDWQVAVPVYQATDCANPNGSIPIVGFATVVITDVLDAPTHTVLGRVECNYVDTGRGGGGNYGTMGTIPGLVQ
ncbi:MAG: hypothetical protein A4E65_00668 [Syntrophorhabdus sp. PtaU1.Bin153]|nr:MAG: hypothetical protein A4E65_00668 [Syntrophorhabdus sp. PtaU1.Bin153]